MPYPNYTPEVVTARGEEIYQQRIRHKVEPEHKGKFLVLDKVEVVIDTGFTGFLMLPSDLIKRLKLQLIGNRRAILGDGSSVSFDLFADALSSNG